MQKNTSKGNELTVGESLYILHGCKGARGEAAMVFPTSVNIGMPALKEALNKRKTFNQAMMHSLISIMKSLDDTNVMFRGGLDGIKTAKRGDEAVLKAGSVFTQKGEEAIRQLDRQLIKLNIRPGGSADMLALSVFFIS